MTKNEAEEACRQYNYLCDILEYTEQAFPIETRFGWEIYSRRKDMGMKEYQEKALETAMYPTLDNLGIYYTALGLCSEAGEVAGKIKKALRDNGGNYHAIKDDIKKELGDVLWYCATLADEFGLFLSDVAECNIEKLASRKERGVIRGSGDDR